MHCNGRFCPECVQKIVVSGAGLFTCKICKGRVKAVVAMEKEREEQNELGQVRNFWRQLTILPAVPLLGGGFYKLFMEGVFLAILTFPFSPVMCGASAVLLVFGSMGAFFLLFFLAALVLRIVEQASVSDEAEIDSFPSLLELEEWVVGVFQLLFVMVYCLWPASLYFYFIGHSDAIFYTLLFSGLYFMPMYFLLVALKEQFSIFNPLPAIISVVYTILPYTILFFLMTSLMFLGYGVITLPLWGDIPFLGYICQWLCGLYFLHLIFRPLGIFYRSYEHNLTGFETSENY